MTLIKCPECEKKISDKAISCPNCGFPINDKEEKNNSSIKLIPAKCPSCGSNIKVDKQDTKTKCSYCNTTILVSDAIAKFKIELSGEVEIKNLPKLKNLIKIADRAYENEDYEQALDIYKKIITIDPDDWKSTFREGICTAKVSTLRKFDLNKAIISSKNALKVLFDKKTSQEDIANYKISMAKDLIILHISFFDSSFNDFKENEYSIDSINEMWNRLLIIKDGLKFIIDVLLNDNVISLCPEENAKEWKITVLKEIVFCNTIICEPRKYISGYNQYGYIYDTTTIAYDLRAQLVNEYDNCVSIVQESEPDYFPIRIKRTYKKNGCYIATCIYGSYDCPQVWTLRRYRDYKLSKTWYGKLFIKIYYITSPTIVKVFGKTKWFNNLWKPKLDRIVNKLNNEGYDFTPYDD